jgi:hypothetical protein
MQSSSRAVMASSFLSVARSFCKSGGHRHSPKHVSGDEAERPLSAPCAGSSTHLAVLTSDSAWQLYHAADFSLPEQRFALRLQPRRWLPFLIWW